MLSSVHFVLYIFIYAIWKFTESICFLFVVLRVDIRSKLTWPGWYQSVLLFWSSKQIVLPFAAATVSHCCCRCYKWLSKYPASSKPASSTSWINDYFEVWRWINIECLWTLSALSHVTTSENSQPFPYYTHFI